MSRILNWVKVPRNSVISWSILITLILPWLFPLFHISTAIRVGVLFILIDMFSAWWIGKMIHRYHLAWWWLFVLPVLFATMVFALSMVWLFLCAGLYFAQSARNGKGLAFLHRIVII